MIELIKNIPTNETELSDKQLKQAYSLAKAFALGKFVIFSLVETILIISLMHYISFNIIQNDILDMFITLYAALRVIYRSAENQKKLEGLKNGRQKERKTIRNSSSESK